LEGPEVLGVCSYVLLGVMAVDYKGPRPIKHQICHLPAFQKVIDHRYHAILDIGLTPAQYERFSTGNSTLFVSPCALFMNNAAYEAACARMPAGVDTVPRGMMKEVNGTKFKQLESRSMEFLNALREKKMKIIFLIRIDSHKKLIEQLIEAFGYRAPLVVSTGGIPEALYLKNHLAKLDGGCIFVLDESSAQLDSILAMDSFDSDNTVLVHYRSTIPTT